MVHRKIKTIIFVSLFFTISSLLYGNEIINVSSQLKRITKDYILFDVCLFNNTIETLYFYPNGITGSFNIVNESLMIETNNDYKYGENFIAAHSPYWENIECIELRPQKKVKYRYKKKINYNLKTKITNNININYSICVINTNITDINNFEEYLQCMRNNILSDEIFLLTTSQ